MEVERAEKSPESSANCSSGTSLKVVDDVDNGRDALDADAYAYGFE